MVSFESVFSPGDPLLKAMKSLLTTNTKGMDKKRKNVIAALTIVGVGSGATLRKIVGFWTPWRKKKRLRNGKNGKKCLWTLRNIQKSLPSLAYLNPPSSLPGLSPLVLKPKNPLWRSRRPNICILSQVRIPLRSSFLISLI